MSRAPLVAVSLALAAAGCGRYGFGDGGADAGVAPPGYCDDIPGVLVCSGFEGDFADWRVTIDGQGSATDVCPTPRSGEQCLVSRIDAASSAARATQMYRPIDSGMLYARVHARIEAGVAIDGINLVALDAYDSGVYGPDLNVVSDSQLEVYMEEVGVLGGASIGPVPLGSWFCLHAAILVDETDGSVTAGYGDASLSVAGIDTYPNAPYDMVAVGLDWSSAQQAPITVMIDDVVVATSPLPCP